MLSSGQLVALTIEKPAAGGPMIARVDGQIVLVTGAIPGERVTARIDKVGKGVAFARTVAVDEPSADRRETFPDPLCGGSLYAYIAYRRQLEIKAQVVADAFARIGHVELPSPVAVRPSPESGYRMRARLHVGEGRVGFFREGSHDLCDARATEQLLPGTLDVAERLIAGLRSLGIDTVRGLDVSENIEATERAVHLETASAVDPRPLVALANVDGLSGLSIAKPDAGPVGADASDISRTYVIAGAPYVRDVLPFAEHRVTLRRHVLSFFQGNRFLLRDLVHHVIGQIDPDGEIVDLYAGVGLFAISAALVHGARVIAVEGDRMAAQDLEANARSSGGTVESVCQPVEMFAARTRVRPRTVIVDPPRTGMSRATLEGSIRLGARLIVYVSCDVATLARDSRHLIDAGYLIRHVEAFDLFPNTPHVETVVAFERT